MSPFTGKVQLPSAVKGVGGPPGENAPLPGGPQPDVQGPAGTWSWAEVMSRPANWQVAFIRMPENLTGLCGLIELESRQGKEETRGPPKGSHLLPHLHSPSPAPGVQVPFALTPNTPSSSLACHPQRTKDSPGPGTRLRRVILTATHPITGRKEPPPKFILKPKPPEPQNVKIRSLKG